MVTNPKCDEKTWFNSLPEADRLIMTKTNEIGNNIYEVWQDSKQLIK
jgi:hypothetical protein